MNKPTETLFHRINLFLLGWVKLTERRQRYRMRLWDPAVVVMHKPVEPRRPEVVNCLNLPSKELPRKNAA